MEIKKGISVSPGVVISTAIVLDAEDLVIPKRHIEADQVAGEVARLHTAIESSTADLTGLRESVSTQHGKEIGAIFDVHLGLLRDKSLINQVINEIKTQQSTAEYGLSVVMRKYRSKFQNMSDRYLSERVKDIDDIEKRLLRVLIGQKREDLGHLTQAVVVIAHDLLPSQTAALDRKHVVGFATDVGGRTSHTAIVARAMGIPAVVGLGNITAEVSGGDTVIIDGTRGVVIVNPNAEQIAEYAEAEEKFKAGEEKLRELRDEPGITQDGHAVSLQANIEFPSDVDEAIRRGAQGIGLYRTEFLYLAGDKEPTEEDHYQSYADTLRRLGGQPLVIRTLDLGGR